jgi:RNA-directed DNA polymerase
MPLVDSYHYSPGWGLPIGALTSQYLGNFFLDAIDHWVNQRWRIRRYQRYMDDMLLFGGPETLHDARRAVSVFLESLGLRLKNGGVLNRCELRLP